MQSKKCEYCGKLGHYQTFCPSKPNKPIKSTSKRSVASSRVKKDKSSTKTKKKPQTRSKLVKELDSVVSQYIRLKYADANGMVKCYTCDAVLPWREMQCGHFFTRGRYPTRWDEMNLRPQNYRCNIALSGNYIVFTRKMIAELGEEAVDELERKSLSSQKTSTPQLREMIEHYKTEVERLKSEKNL